MRSVNVSKKDASEHGRSGWICSPITSSKVFVLVQMVVGQGVVLVLSKTSCTQHDYNQLQYPVQLLLFSLGGRLRATPKTRPTSQRNLQTIRFFQRIRNEKLFCDQQTFLLLVLTILRHNGCEIAQKAARMLMRRPRRALSSAAFSAWGRPCRQSLRRVSEVSRGIKIMAKDQSACYCAFSAQSRPTG